MVKHFGIAKIGTSSNVLVPDDEHSDEYLMKVHCCLHRYSVNAQVICDRDRRILALFTGMPGSCADASVFSRLQLSKSPEAFFSSGQYLLADSAYALTLTVIPSYKLPTASQQANADFNYCVAKARACNEHCIGVWKGRFSSVREIRVQVSLYPFLRC